MAPQKCRRGADPKITLNLTLNVVLDGVSLVKQLPWIDAKRLYLFGYSRGAFFAALLVNRIEEIKGVILQSGAYDLNRFYWDEVWFRPMLNPSGEENPKLPSILPDVATWHAPTLVIHGELEVLVFVQQAYLLRDALKATNIPYELVIYPYYGHVIPREDVEKEATAFLKETSGSACRADAS
jgi:dipeptidyl aminopeptidase/acylaminoacyl peptidase